MQLLSDVKSLWWDGRWRGGQIVDPFDERASPRERGSSNELMLR